jgi:hypothetical protein
MTSHLVLQLGIPQVVHVPDFGCVKAITYR